MSRGEACLARNMNIALKEWSAVIAALGRGMQIFLLRKGGIVEAKRGFEPKYAEFLLFPTFEHQHARYLKPEHAGLLSDGASENQVRITHLARVTDVLLAPPSSGGMQEMHGSHVWNDDFIQQRYDYRPDLPLYLLVIRVCRLSEPHSVPLRPLYAGCKSWVNLTEDIPEQGAQPVLNDVEFAERRRDLLARPELQILENREQSAE